MDAKHRAYKRLFVGGSSVSQSLVAPQPFVRSEAFGYGLILLVGVAEFVACGYLPADLPFWMPWEFSWPEYLVTAFSLYWFALGLKRLNAADHPPLWRKL